MQRLFRLLLCLLLVNPLLVQAAPPAHKKTVAKTENTARIGYLLLDAESGRVLDASREREVFLPASVAKVPTTLAALHILGSGFRFVTSVKATGPLEAGVVKGDLILVGSGDPSFNIAGVMDLLMQLKIKGIKKIQGRFLFDESALLPAENITEEQNEEESYNQGVSALSMEFNRVQFQWSLAKNGQLTTRFTPALGNIEVVPGPAAKAGPSLVHLGGEGTERWRLNPRNARSGWEWVPVRRPARHAALFFREMGGETGIELPLPAPGQAPANATTLASHASAPLSDLVDPTLEHSNNLWTELIGMTAAAKWTKQPQSVSGAAKVLAEWIAGKLPQTDWSGYRLTNGSGLSSSSRVTPKQVVEILQWANTSLAGERSYLSMLPISGWKGTLSRRFTGPSTFRVWAKTGTVVYGKGLAGYLFTRRHSRLIFAVFVSDFEQRRIFDARMKQHLREEIAQGNAWNSQATAQINALVERWLQTY
ncbi:MAG: D-alanyl-D-alanine carboxypeptidase/D-alanyl-D-alanine-endopeptidase [Magnetococcales bacterium]|nr:D-alanyl-D-alanine carboxypeptidase/D-alanyl-D-alanine-endopeptidase [Magnetococcales bacterium]